MKNEELLREMRQTEQQFAKKQPYEPPKAIFVPHEMEDRLAMCSWMWKGNCNKTRI